MIWENCTYTLTLLSGSSNHVNKICIVCSFYSPQLQNARHFVWTSKCQRRVRMQVQSGGIITWTDMTCHHISRSSDNGRALTHWGRDKMYAISQTTFSSAFSWMKMFELRLKISLKFVPEDQINKIPSLVQIMACRLDGAKPLSEPMMVSFLTYMRHAASMS